MSTGMPHEPLPEHLTPTWMQLLQAAERIAPFVHRTPVMRSTAVNRLLGVELFFKCENLQKVGAFKARGATNAVLSLAPEQAARGVATHSSGNHAAALAYAAALRGISAHIVMPLSAPPVKRAAVLGYGAQVTECEPTLAAREAQLAEVVKRTGAVFIHPYDDPLVIAGQGTAALELLDEVPELEVVMTPVGGGGLLSGTALAVAGRSPTVRVLGGEPRGADDAQRSLRSGVLQPSVAPATIADGLLTSLSERTFAIIRRHVEDILTVDEGSIIEAMRMIWQRMKLVVEPSAVVPLAAVLEHREEFAGRRIGVILSGGNVEIDRLPW